MSSYFQPLWQASAAPFQNMSPRSIIWTRGHCTSMSSGRRTAGINRFKRAGLYFSNQLAALALGSVSVAAQGMRLAEQADHLPALQRIDHSQRFGLETVEG